MRMHMKVNLLAVVAMLLGLVLSAASALGVDKVTLKDGKVIEGTITREVDGIVWIKYQIAGIPHEDMFAPSEVSKIERDAASTPAPTDPVAKEEPVKHAARPGVPRAAVITLGSRESDQGDEIGVYITAHELKTMIPMLEEELGTDHTGI